MSLVETVPIIPPPRRVAVREPVTTQPRLPGSNAAQPGFSYALPVEESWASQLVHLASQYHGSEYNRLKFGPQGCPISYIPLSMQLPSHVKELKNLQAEQWKKQAWWHYDRNLPGKPVVLGPCGDLSITDIDLQAELSAAIAAPLPSTPTHSPITLYHPQVKTSETHPINVSSIIPPDLITIISSRLTPSQSPSPIVFDISPAFTLERIIGSPILSVPNSNLPPFRDPGVSVPGLRPMLPSIQTGASIAEALQAAINSGLAAATIPLLQGKAYNGIFHSGASQSPNQSTISLPKLISSALIPPAFNLSYGHEQVSNASLIPSSADGTFIPLIPLGNLFLSSCPGKKVRLSGPVRGRSAVCRDVTTDLRRIRDLGVRCIVCCLDDKELEFLGAPWPEYSQAAQDLGLDVLRIPTPEGLAPLTPEDLDRHLTSLIKTYTLLGFSISVHCRGGVGRAGLVACCWMLKLGLCGWIETDPRPSGATATTVRRDTLQLVERVISVVRRRRSVKAVETFEQVKFLVEYVDFLRSSA